MRHDIKVPPMGESIQEASVGNLLKANGAPVKMDEEILELETDKVNQVLYAPASGVLHLEVGADETVKIGQTIGYVESSQEEAIKTQAPKDKELKQPIKESKPKSPSNSAASGNVERITKDAFLEELSRKEPVDPLPTATPAKEAPRTFSPALQRELKGDEPESRKRMTKIRKVIAQRLVESQQNSAMLTTFNEVDMSVVMEMRAKHQEAFTKKYGFKLGFMPFFVKAAVSALKAQPGLNSYIDGDELVERHYYSIGVAVGTDRGLMVPVVRQCDTLSFAQVEQAINGFAKRAREGTIGVEDLQGGGFTITNGGIYGSMLSTPILNPPQSGILGMHNIVKRAVVVNDQIVIRPVMYLALSYDHRIVDGKEAVSFLVHVKQCIEDPSRLTLEL